MDIKIIFKFIEEFIYILCGLITLLAAFKVYNSEKKDIPTIIFWILISIIFIFGSILSNIIVGVILCIIAFISMCFGIKSPGFKTIDPKFQMAQAKKIGNKIFLPAILIGLIAIIISFLKFNINDTVITIPSSIAIGSGGLIALIVGIILIKPKASEVKEDTSKLVIQIGETGFLPQLLAALGAIFTAAGVGDVIAKIVEGFIPNSNILIAIIIYVLAMALFTMVMGNAFAAFSVITVGIAVPFLISKGGNPAIIGALGMTAGYCGTLLTPMAANFNIIPAAILETKNKNIVIKSQIPMAILLLIAHIILMYILAF